MVDIVKNHPTDTSSGLPCRCLPLCPQPLKAFSGLRHRRKQIHLPVHPLHLQHGSMELCPDQDFLKGISHRPDHISVACMLCYLCVGRHTTVWNLFYGIIYPLCRTVAYKMVTVLRLYIRRHRNRPPVSFHFRLASSHAAICIACWNSPFAIFSSISPPVNLTNSRNSVSSVAGSFILRQFFAAKRNA